MQQPPLDAADGQDAPNTSTSAGDGAMIKRACDQCRTRKIRCDKESPCSNCRIARRTCSSDGLGQKPREPRQRVLISSQYEKKIDYFGARLAGIEDSLRELTLALKNHPASIHSNSKTSVASLSHRMRGANHGPSPIDARTRSTPSNVPGVAFHGEDDDTDASSDLGVDAFEGESSLTAHTVQASEFLEHVVEREWWNNQNVSPNMQSALSSLKQIVGLQQQRKRARMSKREVKFPNQKPLPPGGFKDLPMPPAQEVVSLLREIKEKPPVGFMLLCTFIAVADFTESCRKLYFATDDFSLPTFIVVNSGLYNLFQEKCIMSGGNSETAARYQQYHLMCRDNLETALSNLPFFMQPMMEAVSALLLGACYAIELSKPSLAWQLNSYGCVMATSLGYHRPQPAPDPLAEKKQALFWFCYMIDKGLALRLGRASILQDYDIELPRTVPNTAETLGRVVGLKAAKNPWKDALEVWIGHAEVQGLTYEHLYSPTALQRSLESRVNSARMLVEKLGVVNTKTRKLVAEVFADRARKDDDVNYLMTVNMMIKSDEVSHYSTLALIYRAIPPSEPGRPSKFNEECIVAARAALTTHQECMDLSAHSPVLSAAYIHWTILYAPFVPFIVVFCHIIETSNEDDLRLLKQFVSSLDVSLSAAVEKLHRLCRIMCDVAVLYVEAKKADRQSADGGTDRRMPLGNDFDTYLSQLGFMPPVPTSGFEAGGASSSAAGLTPADSDMMNASYQSAQLGDWFEGGRHMMGLLEEDLSQFQSEPGAWSLYGQQRQFSLISKPP